MSIVFLRAAAFAVATMFANGSAQALSFNERWQSLFAESEVAGNQVLGDPVSAKAEMVRRVERSTRSHRSYAYRHRAYRHRSSGTRGERRREWYKGGKKWHYVYTRKRGR